MMKKYILLVSWLVLASTGISHAQEGEAAGDTDKAPSYQQCMELAQAQLEKTQEALAKEAAALAAGEMPAQNQGVEAEIDDRVKVHINPYGDVVDTEIDVSLSEEHAPEKPSVAKECKVRYGIAF